MNFPPNYHLYLTDASVNTYFPNLKKGVNFKFTSLSTDQYNCIAWAFEIDYRRIQLYDHLGDSIFAAANYIDLFNTNGYKLTQDRNFEEGKIKIAVYIGIDTSEHRFKHVARLLPNGKWTSKLGDWEDIEHETPEALAGESYGEKIIIMEKII